MLTLGNLVAPARAAQSNEAILPDDVHLCYLPRTGVGGRSYTCRNVHLYKSLVIACHLGMQLNALPRKVTFMGINTVNFTVLIPMKDFHGESLHPLRLQRSVVMELDASESGCSGWTSDAQMI
jgi:hypothetical protein